MTGYPPNFAPSELACKSGDECPYPDRLRHLAWTLQVIRDHFGKGIRVTSAYRSPEHNREVGGVKNSQHVQALAADLQPVSNRDDDLEELIQTVLRLASAGKIPNGGVGMYNSFVHYDMRPNGPARWQG